MKLNLGCGNKLLPGFINVDHWVGCNPDRVLDIAEDGLAPFADCSIDEVIAEHVLEHIGPEPAKFLRLMRELYRVMKPGALLKIAVPHPRTDNFIADPEHVRPILPLTMRLFSRRALEHAVASGNTTTTPFALRLGVDFEMTKLSFSLMGGWADAKRNGRIPAEELDLAIESGWNVVNEIRMELLRI